MLCRRVRDADVTEPSELPNRPLDSHAAARSASQLSLLLDAAKATIDEEFRRSERLDTKSRNQVSLAATMFGVAQVITVGLLNSVLADGGDRKALILSAVLVSASLVALGWLARAMYLSYTSWSLKVEQALTLDIFGDRYIRAAKAGNPNVGERLVTQYAKVARTRRDNNAARAEAVKRAERACLAASACVGLELVLAFVAIIVQRV